VMEELTVGTAVLWTPRFPQPINIPPMILTHLSSGDGVIGPAEETVPWDHPTLKKN
jgi:hypothetical protein